MVRVLNAYFPSRTVFLLITETGLICLALLSAALLRLGPDFELLFMSQVDLWKVAAVAVICFVCLYYSDLYEPFIVNNKREVVSRLMQGLGMAYMAVAFLYYAIPSTRLFQGFGLWGLTLAGLALIIYRQAFIAIISLPRFAEPALILGQGPLATSIANQIQGRPELGIRLLGYLSDSTDTYMKVEGAKRLGGVEDLGEVADRLSPRRIIVALDDRRSKLPLQALLGLKMQGIGIEEGTEFYEITTGQLPIDHMRLSWLVFSPGFRVRRLTLLQKRIFSLLLAVIGLSLLVPLMALIAFGIWVDSPGPIIFRQKRVGKDGKTFTLFKFRTMYVNADLGRDPAPAQSNDPRVTRVGRWLRRARLDEIPQLYNILMGDMYFVGPRPFVPNQEMELAQQIPLYTQRWIVRPGATGWAQVHRGYCATVEDNKEKLAYDLFYIKNMSIGLDLLILLKTTKILLLGRGGR